MENLTEKGAVDAPESVLDEKITVTKIREHNETIQSQIDVMERVIADIVEGKAKLQSQMI